MKAKEAKFIAELSIRAIDDNYFLTTLKKTLKKIEKRALKGHYYAEVIFSCDNKTKRYVEDTLTNLGYSIEHDNKNNNTYIKW